MGEAPAHSVDATPRHGWKAPPILLQSEKFEHRIIAYLKAEGKSNEEIALQTGFSDTTIGYIVKQPWMEGFILELIASRGGDKVETFLQDEVMPSLQLLSTVRDDDKAAARDRIVAAREILDRKFGKPNQPLTVAQRKDAGQMTLPEIDARLAVLQRQKEQRAN